MKRNVDLMIFDLDGTLVDSKQDIALATNLMLKESGLEEVSLQSVVGFIGEGMRRLIERALRSSSPEMTIDDSSVERAMAIFRKHYAQHLTDSTVLYPGVTETLQAFSRTKKAVLTNKPFEFSERLLKALGIRKYFDTVLGGDSLPERKPSPETIWYLMKQFQLGADQTLMIGDSRTDIDCGRAAGVMTCGVTYGFRPRRELQDAGADILIDDLSDLPVNFC